MTPPLAFVAFAFAGRLRERLSRDERRTGRRRLRSIARRRLHAAAAHRDAGRAAAFYVEIERVLRDALSEKLRVPVGGLRLDELADLLGGARAAGRRRHARARGAGGVRRGALLAGRGAGRQARAGRDAGAGGGADRHDREGAARGREAGVSA